MSKSNLKIWDQLRTPDPKYVKSFNRAGFRGSTVNQTWIYMKLTEVFGLGGWGFDMEGQEYVTGHVLSHPQVSNEHNDRAVIHVVWGRIWFIDPAGDGNERSYTPVQFGQTTFTGINKNGVFTDEEAPKKSITDCISKCASMIGAAADIFMGLWDDNKYVNEAAKGADPKPEPANKKEAEPISDEEYEDLKLKVDNTEGFIDAMAEQGALAKRLDEILEEGRKLYGELQNPIYDGDDRVKQLAQNLTSLMGEAKKRAKEK